MRTSLLGLAAHLGAVRTHRLRYSGFRVLALLVTLLRAVLGALLARR
jgi:hypothetical protein